MNDTTQHADGGENPTVHHEEEDQGVGALVLIGILSVVLIIVAVIGMGGLVNVFSGQRAGAGEVLSPLFQTDQQPPEPRLQADPAAELQRLRTQERETLDSYGWVDKDAGVVRIPIDRAIDLIAERGLPTRDQSASDGQ